MVALDVSPEVVQQAVGQKADMLITHHPPIFKPLKNICDSSWQSDLLLKCIENGIAIYSAHTSLDSVLGGVNDVLTEKLFTRLPYAAAPALILLPKRLSRVRILM